MALEPRQTYRLVPRGGPGLTCDSEGVALGGVPVAWSDPHEKGAVHWQVCSADQIGELLQRAYGRQRKEVVDRCQRGLRRVAARLEAGDLALAGIEALMLRLPEIESDGMAKLAAANFERGGDTWEDEPRVPAGQPDGGQWTTGGASSGQPNSQGRPNASGRTGRGRTSGPSSQDQRATEGGDTSPEIVVTSPFAESRRQNANGFFPNAAGGGTFYIPTTAGGQQVRSTEVHADDANAFQVSWGDDGVISLTDAKGTIFKVPATSPEEVESFNATTGRTIGVTVVTFPGTPLAAPDTHTTTAEQREMDDEAAALAEGKRVSEQSWSGRLTTGAVLVATALPALALLPAAAEAPVAGPLNTVGEMWPTTDEVGVGGGRATIQARPYEASIRAPYPGTDLEARTFSATVNGERATGVADAVAEENTAVDAKYVKSWPKSIRNPASRIGKTSWAVKEQARMVAQAKKYEENFEGGVIYHTNSPEFALHYYRVFRGAGITNFRFVITPAGR